MQKKEVAGRGSEFRIGLGRLLAKRPTREEEELSRLDSIRLQAADLSPLVLFLLFLLENDPVMAKRSKVVAKRGVDL